MAARRKDRDATPAILSPTGVIAPIPIHIETPVYSGSLSMLLGCVREHKVSLMDVPLLPICEAYFHYLIDNGETHLDEAAAALAALSYLLERKAWLLLPVEQPEPESVEDPMELPEPTTYEFQEAIEALRMWEEERSQWYFRPLDAGPDPYELPYTLGDVSASDLARALERVLTRARPEPPQVLNKARRSLSEQMGIVIKRLSKEWSALEMLLEEPYTRADVVYFFLALLELIRLGQANVRLYDGDVQFAR